jgi:hypothetical protein
VILGILCATIANHACAGFAGAWLRGLLSAELLRWLVGVSFLAIAAWALVPDRMDENQPSADRPRRVPRHARGVLLRRVRRQDAGGDADARRTLRQPCRGGGWQHARHALRGRTGGGARSAAPFAIPLRAVRLAASALFGALAPRRCSASGSSEEAPYLAAV